MTHSSLKICRVDWDTAEILIKNQKFMRELEDCLKMKDSLGVVRNLIYRYTPGSSGSENGWGRPMTSGGNGLESAQIASAIYWILGKPAPWDYLSLKCNFDPSFIPPPPGKNWPTPVACDITTMSKKDVEETKIIEWLLGDTKFLEDLEKAISNTNSLEVIREMLRLAYSHKWAYSKDSPRTISTLTKLWKRLQYPMDWDYLKTYSTSFPVPNDQYFRPKTTAEAINSLTKTENKETSTMAKFFELKAFINGIDLGTLSKDSIFTSIANKEQAIAKLKAITTQPQMLKDEIKVAEAELAELVEYLNEQSKPAKATQ